MKKMIFGLIGVLVIGLSGCGTKKTQIGFVTCNLNDTFQVNAKNALEKYFADKPEYQVIIQDPQEDVMKQVDMVNAVIAQGVKGLVVVPVDTSGMKPITDAAAAAKIPIVYVNRNPYSAQQMPAGVYYVGSDSIVSGRFQGEELVRINGTTKPTGVCIIEGILTNEAAVLRTRGNEEILGRYSNYTILDKQTANWQQDQGMTVAENWLTKYGDALNVILANSDDMALGAIKAVKERGRRDIIIIGIDGNANGLQAIKDGSMAASVFQDPVGQGAGAADVVAKAIKGEQKEQLIDIPYVLITKDNLSDFLK
jgi:inositol transport system substrate-binding protein